MKKRVKMTAPLDLTPRAAGFWSTKRPRRLPNDQSNGSDRRAKDNGCCKLIVQGGTLPAETDILSTHCKKLQE